MADCHPTTLREYVNSVSGRKHMNRLAAGGVQKNIRGSALLVESVPMPALVEQQQLLDRCSEQRACIAALVQSIASAKALLMSLASNM